MQSQLDGGTIWFEVRFTLYLLLLDYLSYERTSLCSNKPVSVADLELEGWLEGGAEGTLVYLRPGQINCNAD